MDHFPNDDNELADIHEIVSMPNWPGFQGIDNDDVSTGKTMGGNTNTGLTTESSHVKYNPSTTSTVSATPAPLTQITSSQGHLIEGAAANNDMADLYSLIETAHSGVAVLSKLSNDGSEQLETGNQSNTAYDEDNRSFSPPSVFVVPRSSANGREINLSNVRQSDGGQSTSGQRVEADRVHFFKTVESPMTMESGVVYSTSASGTFNTGSICMGNTTSLADLALHPGGMPPVTVPMNCAVCGDTASGVHYGVLACEGCKGFFRRALVGLGEFNKWKCYYEKACDVTHHSRNRCRYCRLQKCLQVGMSRHAAKLGRRSMKMRKAIANVVPLEPSVAAVSRDASADSSPAGEDGGNVAGQSAVDTSVSVEQSAMLSLRCALKARVKSASTEFLKPEPLLNTNTDNRPPTPELQEALEVARAPNLVLMKRSVQSGSGRGGKRIRTPSKQVNILPAGQLHEVGGGFSTILDNSSIFAGMPSMSTSQGGSGPKTSPQMTTLGQDSQHLIAIQLPNGKHVIVATDPKTVSSLIQQQQVPQTSVDVKPSPVMLQYGLSSGNTFGAGTSSLNTSASAVGQQQHVAGASNQTYLASSGLGPRSQPVQKSPLKKRPFRETTPTLGVEYSGTDDDALACLGISPMKLQAFPSPPALTGAGNAAFSLSSLGALTQPSLSGGQHLQQALGLSGQSDPEHLPTLMAEAYTDIFSSHLAISKTHDRNDLLQKNMDTLGRLMGDATNVTGAVEVTHEVCAKCWTAFHNRLNEVLQDVVRFAKRIPGFAALDTDDRVNLVRGGCFEVACIVHSAYIFEPIDAWVGPGDFILTRDQLKTIFPAGESFVDTLFSYSIRLQKYDLLPVEASLLSALMLITPDRRNLINRVKVTQLQESILNTLQREVLNNHAEGSSLFPKMLFSVSTLRELSSEHRNFLIRIKGTLNFPNDLYSETFDLV